LAETWRGYRPCFIAIMKDLLVATSVWAGLFLFKVLTELLPVPGWSGDFIRAVHGIGTIAVYALFAWFSVNDILLIHRSEKVAVSAPSSKPA